MTYYISINSNTIRKNSKNNTNDPPIRIVKSKSSKKPTYAHEIKISGNSRLIYDSGNAILSCGARLVLETDHVEILK